MSLIASHAGMIAAGGSGLWTALNLSAPPKILADNESGATNDGSGYCSTWSDRSGNGYDFTSSGSGARPLIVASGLNGLRTLRFDGSNDVMNQTSTGARSLFTSATQGWMFAIYKRQLTTSKINCILQYYTTAGNGRFAAYSGGNVTGYYNSPSIVMRRLDADSAGVLRSATSIGTAWTATLFVEDWSTGAGKIYTNGNAAESATLTSTGATSSTVATYVYLGCESGSTFSDNEIALIIVGAGSLPSSTEIDKLFGCYMWRFGLQANLPTGHAYKSAAPTI